MIICSVANRVVTKLRDLALEEFTLLWEFKDDVDAMKESMEDLEAVMQDADDKARQGGNDGAVVQRWLTKVKSVAYDIEDVADELDATELIKNHQHKPLNDLNSTSAISLSNATHRKARANRPGVFDCTDREG
uniref:Disease resistance N-terminal domain-containing protein n=1 Tax=Oryza meridionalis TaxID=40149 RepID=A0A0E0F5A3_9ORYZ